MLLIISCLESYLMLGLLRSQKEGRLCYLFRAEGGNEEIEITLFLPSENPMRRPALEDIWIRLDWRHPFLRSLEYQEITAHLW